MEIRKHFHDAFACGRFEHRQKTSVKLVSGQKSAMRKVVLFRTLDIDIAAF